jgi:hypothetical protein
MSNLFKKAAVFTDIHFGLKSDSVVHNNDCMEFIDWFIATAKEQNCETGMFLGDWHHNRASLNIRTLQYSLIALEKLAKAFDRFYFIVGNHDSFLKNSREVNSLEWAKHLDNIVLCDNWISEGDVTIVPWIVEDEHKRIQKIKSKYVFGHFELPHFKMNSLVTMPDHGSIRNEDFDKIEKVFSGHFHLRQCKNNIHYIGNAFPHNFSDTGDSERGCMILEWGNEPEYYSWPNQPLYSATKLSTLIDTAPMILKANMHLKVDLDIDISYEEANFIKDTFVRDYSLREMTLIPIKNNQVDVDLSPGEVVFESIDQIVTSQLTNINSEFYDPKLLLSIYQNL